MQPSVRSGPATRRLAREGRLIPVRPFRGEQPRLDLQSAEPIQSPGEKGWAVACTCLHAVDALRRMTGEQLSSDLEQ